jgi:acyl-CoA thioesterase I
MTSRARLPRIECRFMRLTLKRRTAAGNGETGVMRGRMGSWWLGPAVLVAAMGPAAQGMAQAGTSSQAGTPAGQAQPAASTPQGAAPSTPVSGHPDNEYWRAHNQALAVDFGQLQHYKDANAALKPGEARVVFFGASIVERWKLEESFPGKPYVNRGIGGQTTPQMLVRFRQDVIDLEPEVVVILGGTNDIAGNTGPMTLEETENNLASMAELARANGIGVVLCSLPPAFELPWAPGVEPAPKIVKLNAWMKAYAERKGDVYVDFYPALKDERGGLPATLSQDGVHPLPAGYAIMAPLAEAGIEKAGNEGARD